MEHARDWNEVTLSGKVKLVQETDTDIQAGTLMYAPVYRKLAPLQTVEQRRSAFVGWVYSPFRMNDLLHEVLRGLSDPDAAHLNLWVYDGMTSEPDNLLFSSRKGHVQPETNVVVERYLSIGGRDWTLLIEHDASVFSRLDYGKSWLILGGGTLISLLLFFLVSAYFGMYRGLQRADEATADLRESERRLRILAENESVLVWVAGADGKCTDFNAVWLEFTGRTLAQESGDGWAAGVHPDDLARCLQIYRSAFDARREFTMEYRLRRADGEYRWIVDHGVPSQDAAGEFSGYIGSCMDITERKRMDERMQLTQFAMENSVIEVYWLDADACICYVNAQACATLGYSRDELMELSIPDIDPLFPVAQWESHWASLKQERTQFFETLHKRKDGSVFPVEVWANYVKSGELEYNVAFCRDITRRKENEDLVRNLAYYDSLTKLPNRALLDDRLQQAIAACRRNGGYGALLFLDMDNFKPLNDSYGHAVGDELLIEVAKRLCACVREVDTVARFGGDEFVVVLGELSHDQTASLEQARIVANKIGMRLAEPYVLRLHPAEAASDEQVEHRCTSSIGGILFNGGEGEAETIIKNADIAMYQAKANGRNQVHFFDQA